LREEEARVVEVARRKTRGRRAVRWSMVVVDSLRRQLVVLLFVVLVLLRLLAAAKHAEEDEDFAEPNPWK
jgi:hypothetical protein